MLSLVYGYGVSGKSAVNCLVRLGRQVAVYADKYIKVADGIVNRSGMSAINALEDVGLVVVSPSVELDCELLSLAKAKNIEIIGELELGYRNSLGDIIAITGTNGKTTCTELVTTMLKNAQINSDYYGNIGVPFAENSFDVTEYKVAILEVSSFQLATTELFCPKIGVCLNIGEDHLEYHKNMENYIECKLRIFKNQDESDYAVLNYDDDVVRNFADKINSNIYYFSLKSKVNGCYLQEGKVFFNEEYIIDAKDINIKGEHNIANSLACIVVCKILNMPTNIIVKTLKEFKLSAHRMQLINTINGVKYFDDSKSTNISSALSACKSMVGKTTLLLGGYDKGLDYKVLFDELPTAINTIICFGENKDKLIRDCSNKDLATTIIKADSLEMAIDIASHIICENVLFSPATSSFDRFSSYVERGNFFREYVARLKN